MRTFYRSLVFQLLDPERLRKLPRPIRDLVWRMPIQASEFIAKRIYSPLPSMIRYSQCTYSYPQRGKSIADTSVSFNQRDLLLAALASSEALNGDIVEVGSWAGVTTVEMASKTTKDIYAIDPFPQNCFPGIDEAYEKFKLRTASFKNVRHIRLHSGRAYDLIKNKELSLVFVDAMHDFISSYYDIRLWSANLLEGGFLAMHDVDDHPGVNLSARIMLQNKRFRLWGYCPNLLILKCVDTRLK